MRLRWQIKESLIAYLRGLADFQMELVGATQQGADFFFPASAGNPAEPNLGEGIAFDGAVRFTGHGGMLDLTFGSPTIVHSGGQWLLTIIDSHDPQPLALVQIGSFIAEQGAAIRGTGVELTEEGTDLFFGPYTKGTPFDDLWVLDAPQQIIDALSG